MAAKAAFKKQITFTKSNNLNIKIIGDLLKKNRVEITFQCSRSVIQSSQGNPTLKNRIY